MDVEKCRQLAEQNALIKEREAELGEMKKEYGRLEKEVLDEMMEDGAEGVKVSNGERKVNLAIKRQVFATNMVGPDETAEACEAAGLGDMVHKRVNANTLSAYVRELERNGEEPPAEFEGVVGTHEKFSVSVTLA